MFLCHALAKYFFLSRHSNAFVFFKRRKKSRSDGQMACFLFMNIEQGDRMAVRMIFHTLLPSLNIAATNHVPQTTFSVFSHFFCFFFFILLLSFMILSFQFSPSSYLSNFSKYMTSSLLPFRPHRLVSSFLVIPDLHNDLLLLLYFFITFFHSSLL